MSKYLSPPDVAIRRPGIATRAKAGAGSSAAVAGRGVRSGSGRRNIRADIEGMRAVAVLSVLLSHAGVLPGGFAGVDVFFVISGFLITGLLVTELETTGRLSLVGFYARRAKRLLPGAAVVLSVALLLTYLFLPKTRWSSTGWDVVTSALYAMNWRLAEQSVDYLAADRAPSLVQHFWSLAVEEQFYLVWPLLLLLVTAFARRRWSGSPLRLRRPLLIALAVIAVPSLVWSVHLTYTQPAPAYFVTTTRMWELALGGGLAILAGQFSRLPRHVAVGLGWAGLAAVVASAVILRPSMPFPGYAALLPTLGVAAVIAAGVAAGPAGPIRILGTAPMQAIGALSYSLYLWHWPLLVVATAKLGDLSVPQSLAVAAFSAMPAYLTYRFVENPLRLSATFTRSPGRAIQLGVACTLIPVVAGTLFPLTGWPPPARPPITNAGELSTAHPAARGPLGAAVLPENPSGSAEGAPVDRVKEIIPDPRVAHDDQPALYAAGCHADQNDSTVKSCVYGDKNAPFTVALVGDSHAGQWAPTLQAVATAKKWKLVTFTKSSCPLINVDIVLREQPYRTCSEWNTAVREKLLGGQRPNLIVTSSSFYRLVRDGKPINGDANNTALVTALRDTWNTYASAGIATVVLRNIPYPGFDVPECVLENADRLTRCTVPREKALSVMGPEQVQAASGLRNVHLIDLNDAICPTDRCAAVIGGALIYSDSNHLTATYARSLAPRLDAMLAKAVTQ